MHRSMLAASVAGAAFLIPFAAFAQAVHPTTHDVTTHVPDPHVTTDLHHVTDVHHDVDLHHSTDVHHDVDTHHGTDPHQGADPHHATEPTHTPGT